MNRSLVSLTKFGRNNFRLFGLCLLVAAVLIVLRLALMDESQWSNVTPVAGVAVCFGLFIPRGVRVATLLALGGLLLSDVVLNLVHAHRNVDLSFWDLMLSPAMLLRYAIFVGLVWMAGCLRRWQSTGLVFIWTPLASLIYYAATNTFAWAVSTGGYAYAKTLAGWWQSQTIGLPGFMPSYLFLRNALLGDLAFTVAFVALVVWMPKSRDSLLNPAENPL